MGIPTVLLRFSILLFAKLFITVLYRAIQNYRILARETRLYGCAAPVTVPSWDQFFGLDTAYRNLRAMKENRRMKDIYAQIQAYGHTFQSFPFGRRTIFTADARNVQFVYATEHEKFGVGPIRERAQSPLTGRGIITSDGAVWGHARDLIKPTFTRSQIADRESFDVHVERFLELLPQDGSTVDLQHLFDRLILDASSEFIFGESFGSLLPDCPIDSKTFLECFDYAQKVVGMRVQLGKMDFLIRDPKFRYSYQTVHNIAEKYVDRAMLRRLSGALGEKEAKKHVLVHELADVTHCRKVLREHLLNIFFAGRDTPAVALTNVFFCLARHPTVWRKLREEVMGLQPEDLTFEKLKALRYVQHVINEALRLYPPVANNSRSCLEHSILPTGGGADGTSPILVFPGDTISINFFALHRNPAIYENPEEFRPERWERIRPKWDYLPFGGGARHCPAQQLALFWVGSTLVRMVLRFKEIENRDPVIEYVENLKLNMESLNGAKVGLTVA
ncbi:cytochrome P450 [Delitschia confertaspora ATCC 74209]|uniref:Cytochrome P450 n=1 Tax=Delitschia confertaspora ATCC 74209 TaxID=1513339 RepID=A0A9P4JY41_9PLEO|nr:cytochrome P450 [Delitschia confertaspora ATCC 74209]